MKITLADIAQKTGVTISTVQRALNGGNGVSDVKRIQIQKTATEMGYKRNFYASSLRRGYIRIAVIFPDSSPRNRFYAHYLWTGIQRYLDEASIPFVEILPLAYDRSPEDHTTFLQQVLDGCHGKIDGIITRGSISPEIVSQFRQLEERGIPLVLAGIDTQPTRRLCCVRSYEKMAGSLAADLLLNFGALKPNSRIMVCGNFSGLNQFNNAQGFERHLWENDMQFNILKTPSAMDASTARASIQELLENTPNIDAIYACNTLSTISACEAVQALGLSGKTRIVGSDLFEESVHMLREGILSALIHNRPVTIAYRSMQALTKYLIDEKERPKDTILVNSAIVMRGNLAYYLQDIPALKKYADTTAFSQ